MRKGISIFAAMSLFALSGAATADNLSGINIGAFAVLGESISLEVTRNDKHPDPGDFETRGASDSFGSADLKIGYNAVLSNGVFLGAEANHNLIGIDKNIHDEKSVNTKFDLSKESSYGLRGKIGVALNDITAVYGIVGYQSSKFKTKGQSGGAGLEDANYHQGFTMGVGLTYAIQNNLLITAEATQTDYGEETYFGVSDIEAKETQFGIGLAYRFDI